MHFTHKKRAPEKEPWQITAGRFCVLNSEGGFTLEELQAHIQLLHKVSDHQVRIFWEEEIHFPSGSTYSRNAVDGRWIPPLDLVSKITDYDELHEARKNAVDARTFAIRAIIVSLVALIASVATPFAVAQWTNQTVELDKIQYEKLQRILQNRPSSS